MVLDYRERNPVNKNRPRKQPIGSFILILVAAMVGIFTLGVGTGWFLSRHVQEGAVDKSNTALDVNQKSPGPSKPVLGQTAAENATTPPEPSLTFYETLPKGSKAVIGSGLNPQQSGEHASVRSVQSVPAAKPEPAAKTGKQAEPVAAVKEKGKATELPATPVGVAKEWNGKGKFAVQVASCRTKKEAEELLAQINTGGGAAYIVESNITGKGTWYRVRIGKHLDQHAARDLAAKTGNGAIVISE